MPSSQSRRGRSSSALTSLSGTLTSSPRVSRQAPKGRRYVSSILGQKGNKSNQRKTTCRPPASLEQRRQVRYLARHYPDLNTSEIAKAVGCSYSAVPKILANTFGGGDTDTDALPRDKVFFRRHGVQDENEMEVTVPVGHGRGSGGRRLTHENTRAEDEPEGRGLSLPLRVAPQQFNPSEQDELEWVAGFFNTDNAGSFKLPASVIREMVAAGLRQYTVVHLMRTYTHKLELSNYLATILRVTHVERDVIAGLIMEKARFFQVLKQEQYN